MPVARSAPQTSQRKNLDVAERRRVIDELLKGSNNGMLHKGDYTRVAEMFHTNRWTIAKLWKDYTQQKDYMRLCANVQLHYYYKAESVLQLKV